MARVYRLELEWSALADDFRTFGCMNFAVSFQHSRRESPRTLTL